MRRKHGSRITWRGTPSSLRAALTSAAGPWGSGAFLYDGLGNLRSQTLGSRQITIGYTAATNRVATVADSAAGGSRSYGYDARGNTTSDGRNAFAYDFANQPTSASGAASHTYAYDGNFKRVKFVRSGVPFYDAYSRVTGKLAYRDNASVNQAWDIQSVGPLSVAFLGGVFHRYHHMDHLGSRAASTDAAGAVLERERYAPFGEQLNATFPNFVPGFTGHSRDADTNLNYMQARLYDPIIGRFLSTDPAP